MNDSKKAEVVITQMRPMRAISTLSTRSQFSKYELRSLDLTQPSIQSFDSPSEAVRFLADDKNKISYKLVGAPEINKWRQEKIFKAGVAKATTKAIIRWLDVYNNIGVSQAFFYDAQGLEIPADQLDELSIWLSDQHTGSILAPAVSLGAAFEAVKVAQRKKMLHERTQLAEVKATKNAGPKPRGFGRRVP